MRADIKERIEKIKRGEVPEGYKKTILGILPTAWTINKMKEICLRNFVGIATSTTQHVRDSGVPLIRNQNITKNKLDTSDMLYITEEFNKMNENKKIEEFDILSVRTGFAGISCVVPKAYKGAQTFTTLVSRPNRKKVNAFYLSYYINSNIGSTIINKLLFGNAQKNLNVAMMEIVDVILPTLPEQEKIATILSTWDKAIELKEKLIQQKKEQKKGLMQNLLTGKVKINGFNSEWKEVKIGTVLKERNETGYNELELLAITARSGVVKRTEIDIKDNSSEDKSKYKRIRPMDIGYNTMRMWQGVSGVSEYEGIVSPAYTILTPTEKIDSYFIGYLFKLPAVINLFHRYSQGMVNDTLNLKYSDLKQIKIKIPSDKNEQIAIAKVLKIIDRSIELAEKELEILEDQKKGLMQLLLTGKVRVEC